MDILNQIKELVMGIDTRLIITAFASAITGIVWRKITNGKNQIVKKLDNHLKVVEKNATAFKAEYQKELTETKAELIEVKSLLGEYLNRDKAKAKVIAETLKGK